MKSQLRLNHEIGVLTEFSILRPKNQLSQDELLHWLALAHARAEAVASGHETSDPATVQRMQRLLARYGCDSRKIGSRGYEISDAGRTDFDQLEIYRIAQPTGDSGPYLEGASGAGMLKRTQFFAKTARSVFEHFYPAEAKSPAHLIHVTCTGYSSPSAPQSTVDLRGWHGHTHVTHAYHMGCYASLPAVRMAEGFLAARGQPVDIVHTEICSLHLNPLDPSPEQLVVKGLFADGHIKYTMRSAEAAASENLPGLEVVGIDEYIIPGTQDCMTWNAADWGMKMTLSREVPRQVAEHLKPFLERLLSNTGIESTEAAEAVFAIHPGGPRIIESTQELLGLSDEQVKHSKEILFNYGNMSSATLPHIWKSILEDNTIANGRWVVSLAFGPGLTIFGAILRKKL